MYGCSLYKLKQQRSAPTGCIQSARIWFAAFDGPTTLRKTAANAKIFSGGSFYFVLITLRLLKLDLGLAMFLCISRVDFDERSCSK